MKNFINQICDFIGIRIIWRNLTITISVLIIVPKSFEILFIDNDDD